VLASEKCLDSWIERDRMISIGTLVPLPIGLYAYGKFAPDSFGCYRINVLNGIFVGRKSMLYS